ncbi:hypothetical protein D4S03_07155, partial [bacterium]
MIFVEYRKEMTPPPAPKITLKKICTFLPEANDHKRSLFRPNVSGNFQIRLQYMILDPGTDETEN